MSTWLLDIDINKSSKQISKWVYQTNFNTDALQYGDVLGKGNGGMVRAGVHKVSNIPVAIKVKTWILFSSGNQILQIVNLFDKDKRHQFYNEFDMISMSNSNCITLVSS